jgi:hypothetical protein
MGGLWFSSVVLGSLRPAGGVLCMTVQHALGCSNCLLGESDTVTVILTVAFTDDGRCQSLHSTFRTNSQPVEYLPDPSSNGATGASGGRAICTNCTSTLLWAELLLCVYYQYYLYHLDGYCACAELCASIRGRPWVRRDERGQAHQLVEPCSYNR